MNPEEKRAKHAAYMRAWSAKNPEKVAALARKTRERHGHKYAEKKRAQLASDPLLAAKNRERVAAWRIANPERYKANMRRSHLRNVEKNRAKAAAWKKANPSKANVNAIEYSHRRRARIAGSSENDPRCKPFVRVVKLIASYSCPYCTGSFNGIPEIDHIMPLSRGGAHRLENLTLACPDCNRAKGARTAEEFLMRSAA